MLWRRWRPREARGLNAMRLDLALSVEDIRKTCTVAVSASHHARQARVRVPRATDRVAVIPDAGQPVRHEQEQS